MSDPAGFGAAEGGRGAATQVSAREESVRRSSEVDQRAPEASPGPADGHAEGDAGGSWRSRVGAAAASRGIPIGTIATTVLVVIAVLDLNAFVVLLLWVLRSLILSLLIASFIAILLRPLVRVLERRGWNRVLASTVVAVATLAVLAGVVVLFTVPLVTNLDHLAHEIPKLVTQAEHGRGWFGRLLKRLHVQRVVSQNLPKLTHDITKSLKPAQALSVGATALSSLFELSVVAVMAFFVLLEAPALWGAFLRTLHPARAARVAAVYAEASRSVTGYMLGNFLTSVIAGVVVFVTLTILGVPFAWLLGVWVGLVDLLPLVGGLLAGVPVVLIAALHSVTAGIVMLVVFLAYQTLENHLLNPIIMSRTVRLNPLWVLLSVLVAASLGGRVGGATGAFIGALLGIPLGGAIQVTAREIRRGPGPSEGEEGEGAGEDSAAQSGAGTR
jgi:predicted PurR-regulated permease PerM